MLQKVCSFFNLQIAQPLEIDEGPVELRVYVRASQCVRACLCKHYMSAAVTYSIKVLDSKPKKCVFKTRIDHDSILRER